MCSSVKGKKLGYKLRSDADNLPSMNQKGVLRWTHLHISIWSEMRWILLVTTFIKNSAFTRTQCWS